MIIVSFLFNIVMNLNYVNTIFFLIYSYIYIYIYIYIYKYIYIYISVNKVKISIYIYIDDVRCHAVIRTV